MAKKATSTKKSTAKSTKASAKSSNVQEFDLINDKWITEEDKKPELTKDDFKIKKPSFFDIINMMFNNPAAFDALPDSLLDENYFMINRRFAIKYPMQAAQFSRMGINQAAVVRQWPVFVKRVEQCYGTPRYIYTKTKKDEKEKIGIDAFDEELITDYMVHYNLSKKDFEDMLFFFNDETVADVERFYKVYSPEEQKKLFTRQKSSKKKFEDDSETS